MIYHHKTRRYNSETGDIVGEDWNGLPSDDAEYISVRLMLNNGGNYFLHARGGKDTPYAMIVGSKRIAGEKIIPLETTEAREWAEEHLSPEDVENFFSPIGERKPVGVLLRQETRAILEHEKRVNGIAMSHYIDRAVLDYHNRQQKLREPK